MRFILFIVTLFMVSGLSGCASVSEMNDAFANRKIGGVPASDIPPDQRVGAAAHAANVATGSEIKSGNRRVYTSCNYEIVVENASSFPIRANIGARFPDSRRRDEVNSTPAVLIRSNQIRRMPTGEAKFPYVHQLYSTREYAVEVLGVTGTRGKLISTRGCNGAATQRIVVVITNADIDQID